ncbi:hypothetical protein B0A49_00884 [Cryomyces minteri]|uniref:Protein-lysine N-methyltransferase EFM4 n=1 Tax=Cryomyces minteri TaxID=331657 RepID=A0A4U0XTE7_9PEZI|nr:hypothetical protein B0A49_00884 [Cryomyces minteri]
MMSLTPPPSPPADLQPSELGTKDYWDEHFFHQRTNFIEANTADLCDDDASATSHDGTINWFAEYNAENKVLRFLDQLAHEGLLHKTPMDPAMPPDECLSLTKFLDLGTGNGHVLFALRDKGWKGPMLGVDYSEQSIELACLKEMARNPERLPGGPLEVDFKQWDIINEPYEPLKSTYVSGFDVVLDKGTFDAISLSDAVDDRGRRVYLRYREKVEPLISEGGFFLITSCNWTKSELTRLFESDQLKYHDSISYPSFTFGGVQGEAISSICFIKRSSRGDEPQ